MSLISKVRNMFQFWNSDLSENVDNLKICGDNLNLGKNIRFKSLRNLAIGSNVTIENNVVLDATAGIAIQDNTVVKKGTKIMTVVHGKLVPNIVRSNRADKNSAKISLKDRKCSPTFIVSTGRSGTKSITDLVDNHPLTEALHEPFQHLGYLSCAKLYGEYSTEQVEKELDDLFKLSFLSKESVLLSDLKFSAFISEIYKLLPNSKFIWLVRNPRDFVSSAYPRGWFQNSEFGYEQEKSQVIEINSKPARCYADFRPNAFKIGLMTEDQWKDMSSFERNCWYWSYWNRMIEDQLQKIPQEQVLKLSLKELNDRKNDVLSFLNLPIVPLDNQFSNKAKYSKLTPTMWTETMEDQLKKWTE